MITVENLGYEVATQSSEGEPLRILHDVSFAIEAGQTVAITGPSGSGKTTLLGLLAGLDVPTSGVITLEGERVSSMSEDERALLRARLVGFVFQSFHLLPSLTALENAALPLQLAGQVSGAEALRLAAEYLGSVGLSHRLRHHPAQLSGGEQQRVAIARAFAAQPRYLFCDEPTGNLDQVTGRAIMDLLFTMNQEHRTTLVMVTHDPKLAALCQRELVIEMGALREQRAPSTA